MLTHQPKGSVYERHRPEKLYSTRSSGSITRGFLSIWKTREPHCPSMSSASLKTFFNVVVWKMDLFELSVRIAKHERLVAFSCKRRGFCPSCGARRMAESSALLIDEVLPSNPYGNGF